MRKISTLKEKYFPYFCICFLSDSSTDKPTPTIVYFWFLYFALFGGIDETLLTMFPAITALVGGVKTVYKHESDSIFGSHHENMPI